MKIHSKLKYPIIGLSIVMLLSLQGCGSKGSGSTTNSNPSGLSTPNSISISN